MLADLRGFVVCVAKVTERVMCCGMAQCRCWNCSSAGYWRSSRITATSILLDVQSLKWFLSLCVQWFTTSDVGMKARFGNQSVWSISNEISSRFHWCLQQDVHVSNKNTIHYLTRVSKTGSTCEKAEAEIKKKTSRCRALFYFVRAEYGEY